MPPKKLSNTVSNYYTKMPSTFKQKSHNPNFKNHLLEIPFRILICGSSGSMKTNCALDIIHKCSNTFEQIIVVTKCQDEPLYNYLDHKCGDGIVFYEVNGDSSVPTIDEICNQYGGKEVQKLIIFDDLMLDKKQIPKIGDFFIRGRKLNFSSMFLTQSYYAKDLKTIRSQCNYIILKKVNSNRDLKVILTEFNLGLDLRKLVRFYKVATQTLTDFLLIDVYNDTHKFRKNFNLMLDDLIQ